jgi:uncharacterized protein YaaQ
MFILTIDSDDVEVIRSALKEICEERLDTNATGAINSIGVVPSSITYEYSVFEQQPWVAMFHFLHFNRDGNTLKLSGLQC